jgi:hypothetical protein
MFGTLQDRLIKKLAKVGIIEIEAANAWIRDSLSARPQSALCHACGAAAERHGFQTARAAPPEADN